MTDKTPMTDQGQDYKDTPVCIDEYGDGVYRRIHKDGSWYAIEKYSGAVVSYD